MCTSVILVIASRLPARSAKQNALLAYAWLSKSSPILHAKKAAVVGDYEQDATRHAALRAYCA
jgi:hypothetical protein